MKSLLWKQWHENRGYLAIFLAWMVLAAVYCIGYEVGYRFHAPVGHFSGLALFYAICAAVFLAMRASQGEQSGWDTFVFGVAARINATNRSSADRGSRGHAGNS